MEPSPPMAPKLHLIDRALFREEPAQSSSNVSNKSHGGGCRMENMGYKVDGMIPTSCTGSITKEERNGILNSYTVYTKGQMFLPNPHLLSTEIHSSKSRLALFHDVFLFPTACGITLLHLPPQDPTSTVLGCTVL